MGCHGDKENRWVPTKLPNMRVRDAALGYCTHLLEESKEVILRNNQREKIARNEVYHLYVRNEKLFKKNEWICINKNIKISNNNEISGFIDNDSKDDNEE